VLGRSCVFLLSKKLKQSRVETAVIAQVVGGAVFSLLGVGSIIFCKSLARLNAFLLEQMGRPGYRAAAKVRPFRIVVMGISLLVIGLLAIVFAFV
jgi:hypothetical protein